MYSDDSFHTLTQAQQFGLICVSICLSVFTAYFLYKIIYNRPLLIRVILAIFSWALFVWLSPQFYYVYYLLIFDNLPIQIVIHTPPSPVALIKLLSFQADQNLSNHAVGALGWGLILLSYFSARKSDR